MDGGWAAADMGPAWGLTGAHGCEKVPAGRRPSVERSDDCACTVRQGWQKSVGGEQTAPGGEEARAEVRAWTTGSKV